MSARKENLTDEKFNSIHTDKKFRNECANARGCCDRFHVHKHYATCSYPVSYIITKDQINEARAVREKQIAETLEKYNSEEFDNVLVLVTMGMDFDPKTVNDHDEETDRNLRKSDIGNYRIRGDFKTPKGKFFVEYMTDGKGGLYCDFSLKYVGKEKKYGYGGIERQWPNPSRDYTTENILNEVNRTFGANFTRIHLDRYDIGTDDFCSRSINK